MTGRNWRYYNEPEVTDEEGLRSESSNLRTSEAGSDEPNSRFYEEGPEDPYDLGGTKRAGFQFADESEDPYDLGGTKRAGFQFADEPDVSYDMGGDL